MSFLSKRLLPLIPAGLLVQQILPFSDHLTILVTLRQAWAACPTCAAPTRRGHSQYGRILHTCPGKGVRCGCTYGPGGSDACSQLVHG